MNRLAALLIVLIPVLATPAAAVQPYTPTVGDPVTEPWRWRSFPELEGKGLRCLVEDGEGRMWFGVDRGVVCYDGLRWTAYTAADGLWNAPVNALHVSSRGDLYAGSTEGISRLRDGVWERIFPEAGLATWPVNSIRETSDGSLWAGTSWGALRFRDGRPVLFTSGDVAAAVKRIWPQLAVISVPDSAAPVNSYAMVMGSTGPQPASIGVQVVQEAWTGMASRRSSPVVWDVLPGGPADEAGLQVGDCIVAINGIRNERASLLGGPPGTRVSVLVARPGVGDSIPAVVTRRVVEGSSRDFPVYDVFEDRDGRLWFGMQMGQVVRCHPREGRLGDWKLFDGRDGLAVSYSPRIAQTPDGAVWYASNGGGLPCRYRNGQWQPVPLPRDAPTINASILVADDGAVWLGSFGGLLGYRDGAWQFVLAAKDLPIPWHRPQLYETRNGRLWVAGLGQGAAYLTYSGPRWRTYLDLVFQFERPEGDLWFVERGSGVVRRNGNRWERFDAADGLMDRPSGLLRTRSGAVWAVGSHQGTAATSRFVDGRWSLDLHRGFAQSIEPKAVIETADGSLWFPASIPRFEEGEDGGVLQYRPGRAAGAPGSWTHHEPPDALTIAYAAGESRDGRAWFGGVGLRWHDAEGWHRVSGPLPLTNWVQAISRGVGDDLWVGTRLYGVYRHDGERWHHYLTDDGLADNAIYGLSCGPDGSVWASTKGGISRFDGRTWTRHAIHPAIQAGGALRFGRDGAVWITQRGAVRYLPDADPPETEIVVGPEEVSQPGNALLAWRGIDPWRNTPDGSLRYSWRLNGGRWSPYSPETSRVFLALDGGDHVLEVRARDEDQNEDPTPAVTRFRVTPVIWLQPWFLALLAGLLAIIGVQSTRVLRRGRRLRQANEALSTANGALVLDRAVERVRGVAGAMASADDLAKVLRQTMAGLREIGAPCEVGMLSVADGVADGREAVCRRYGWTQGRSTRLPDEPLKGRPETGRAPGGGTQRSVERLGAAESEAQARGWAELGLGEPLPPPAWRLRQPLEEGELVLFTSGPEGFPRGIPEAVGRFGEVVSEGHAHLRERARLDEQERELERSRVLTQTAGAAAHEMNQPLTVLLGTLQLLSTPGLKRRPLETDMEALRTAAEEISQIVKKMREVRQYATKPYVNRVEIVDFDQGRGDEEKQDEG